MSTQLDSTTLGLPVDSIRPSADEDPPGYGDTNTFIRITFVLLARMGFLLIQMGSIPVENVYRITFLNIFEIGIAIISYISIGYMITFGEFTYQGYVGYSLSIGMKRMDDGILGICAVLLGSGQLSCFLTGRVHIVVFFFTTFLYCGALQPLLGHWIWNEEGWMRKFVLAQTKVSVKDYAGDLVIHQSSSLTGAIGASFLGRRLMKLKDLDERSLAREYSGLTFIGYVLIIMGYAAFNLPSQGYQAIKEPANYIALILLNMFAAFATGIFFTSLLQMCILKRIFNYWSAIRCLQGGIAGLISIAAGVDIYNYLECSAISAVSSIFFFLFSIMIHNTSLEDNCNLIASHFVGSIFGTVACPIIATKENFEGKQRIIHILWQLICLFIVMSCTIVFAWFMFLSFALCRLLRNTEEVKNHRRAVVVAKHLPRKGCMQRLFMIDGKTDHITPGEIGRQKYLQEEEKL